MVLSVRAMSPRAAWAASVSAALPFVNRIVIVRHSNWKNNYKCLHRFLLLHSYSGASACACAVAHICTVRGGDVWQPPLQLLGKNITVRSPSIQRQ